MNVKLTKKMRDLDTILSRKIKAHTATKTEDELFDRICETINYIASRQDRKLNKKEN
jgi:hypothetical protein